MSKEIRISYSLAAFREPFIAPPSEVQLIPFGKHSTDKGDFVLDHEGAASIIGDFESRQNDMVLDYEHQTLLGSEAPAAGWIKRLVFHSPSNDVIPASEARRESFLKTKKDSGDSRQARTGSAGMTTKKAPGIWAVVQWTPRAIEYLRNREYRYISPVFLKRASDGRVMRLINAALTNQPAIDGMVPVVNKKNPPNPPLEKGGFKKQKEERMEKLFALLGLKADATEEQAMEAVTSMKEGKALLEKDYSEVLKALGLKEVASVSEATGTIEAFKQGHEGAGEFGRRVLELEEKLRDKEASELVSSAMKAGKVTPAQKEWAAAYAGRDPEGFRTFIAKAPVVVPVGQELAGGTEPHGRTAGAPDGIQLAVNRAMGIDAETFKKHSNKKEVS